MGILALAALAGIIYIFISKKSSNSQRVAALIAIILSGLTLAFSAVYLILNLNGKETETPVTVIPLNPDSNAVKDSADYSSLIIFLVFLLIILAIIIYMGTRDKKRKEE